MAARRKRPTNGGAEETTAPDLTSEKAELRRIANLLGLLLVREMGTGDKARTLSSAGFSNAHIAALLDVPANQVRARLAEKPDKRKGAAARRGSE